MNCVCVCVCVSYPSKAYVACQSIHYHHQGLVMFLSALLFMLGSQILALGVLELPEASETFLGTYAPLLGAI
jgi:hypothetical protein